MSVARGGRLPDAVDRAMQELNQSVELDRALWREDIRGSVAHARGLARAGVISSEDAARIVEGLEAVEEEIERGAFRWDPVKEDVHMNIEARLVELVGPVGGKLHTGRSRNDQVATDLRLWTRGKLDETLLAVSELARVLLERAREELDVLMPAYTHLQRAQPSRLSHHLMAWQELVWRDRGRLLDARARLDECPLGAGAVAGSGFPLDRAGVAAELGFAGPTRNSLDATASRDFLMEAASALAILGVHLSRIGEEIVLWSSAEFGFMALDDRFSTSSSMMPQKKNPDVAELVRGKAARAIGSVTALLVLEKSLAFGYGRDLQEDKRPIFDAFEGALLSLAALTGAIATARFDRARLLRALGGGHVCATDLADFLVLAGLPFRDAHHVVGGLVREAEARGVELGELPPELLSQAHPALAGAELRSVLDPEAAVERRDVVGGPARRRVLEALADARARWGHGP
ncbi:MAG: argininosuccinate lyase [Sorangiineae bacterium]|nr:argininosuccinate lyase [Polyangiaceae bacterium]MEB2322511.1 argininosuccinate lyase [Sorangiineae bacterium]